MYKYIIKWDKSFPMAWTRLMMAFAFSSPSSSKDPKALYIYTHLRVEMEEKGGHVILSTIENYKNKTKQLRVFSISSSDAIPLHQDPQTCLYFH